MSFLKDLLLDFILLYECIVKNKLDLYILITSRLENM